MRVWKGKNATTFIKNEHGVIFSSSISPAFIEIWKTKTMNKKNHRAQGRTSNIKMGKIEKNIIVVHGLWWQIQKKSTQKKKKKSRKSEKGSVCWVKITLSLQFRKVFEFRYRRRLLHRNVQWSFSCTWTCHEKSAGFFFSRFLALGNESVCVL